MRYRIATSHGENGTVYTICRLFGPDGCGWEPVASVRPGQWIGPSGNRYRIVGPRGKDHFLTDSQRFGMDHITSASVVLDLLKEKVPA